jgi:hypothetical protein
MGSGASAEGAMGGNEMNLKTNAAAALLAVVLLGGCRDTVDTPTASPGIVINGDYSGAYTRIEEYSTSNPTTVTGDVSLSVKDGRYQVTGKERYAPPSGCGTLDVVQTGDAVTLDDQCYHTAEFDWTLILNGEFTVTRDAWKIVLEQLDGTHDRFVRLELTKN